MKRIVLLLVALAIMTGLPLGAASGYRDVFIKVNDNLDETALHAAGVTITARYQGFVTALVDADRDLYSLTLIQGVEHVADAIPLVTCTDSARFFSNADPVHQGRVTGLPYTGKGVIVGVIDCGFDFNHINLCDQNGMPRVKAVYMPLDQTGNPPVINGVALPGSCYETPSEIALLTTDDAKTTHGTQVAGIAAGGYRDNGWYGMAPDADIVACGMPEGELNDVRVANCISYIHDYAARMGKPCVINISLGSNVGPHDGTSYFNRVCNQLTGPGSVIVVSAGNDGLTPVSAHRSTTSEQDTVTVLLTGFRGSASRTGYINTWNKNGNPFNTRLVVANIRTGEIVYSSHRMGASHEGAFLNIYSENDSLLAQYVRGSAIMRGTIEENGNPSSLCQIDLTTLSRDYAPGFQFSGQSACDFAMWTSMYAYFNDYGFTWVEEGSSMGSISDLAATDSVISVGAYNTRQTVPLKDGTLYHRDNCTPGLLSQYTSYGPDERGINRPDVSAPGSMMISSGNRYDVTAPNLYYWQPSSFVNGEEYTYCPDIGTSMSAPVVAGAIALWLQANPQLSVNDVREVLRNSCNRDNEVVASGGDQRWGYGKLDIEAGLRYVLHINPLKGDVNADGEVNISDINATIDVLLGGIITGTSQWQRADVDGDGEVTISDINALIDIILNS